MNNIVERLRLDYCSCNEGFTCRGLTDPSCESCSTKDERNEAADLIESQQARAKELEAELLSALAQAEHNGNELAALRQKIEDAPSVAYERKVHGGFAVTYIPSGAGEHEELIRRKDLK